jgi:hypothetical protein
VSQSVGTWVAGDSGKAFRYFVTDDGDPFDVTGATDITLSLIRLASGVETVYAIEGAIVAPATGGVFEWVGASSIGVNIPSPASRNEVHVYEARVTFMQNSLTYWTDPFRIAVAKWGVSTVPTVPETLDPANGLQPIIDDMAGSGGVISLGEGTYYGDPGSPSTPITIPSTVNVVLRGIGVGTTIIGSPTLIGSTWCGLEYLSVQPPGGAYGVKVYDGGAFRPRNWMKHVSIGATSSGAGDGPTDGLILDGAGLLLGDHVTVAFCTRHGLLADSTGAEPNTTLKFDACSFVGNGTGGTGYGVKLLASMTDFEASGGSMEGNVSGEFYADSASLIHLQAVDFESGESKNNQVEIQNSNSISLVANNFVKNSGTIPHAILIQASNGIEIDGSNRFEGFGAIGLVRLSASCTNAHIGVNHIYNGAGWMEDYSR